MISFAGKNNLLEIPEDLNSGNMISFGKNESSNSRNDN